MIPTAVRITGIALVLAVIGLGAWKVFGTVPTPDSKMINDAMVGDLRVPIEIVEAGEEPQIHIVRVTR